MATKIADLREMCGPGYNLACVAEVDDRRELSDILAADGCPVLAEAEGAMGVLRALDVRRPRIFEALAESGREVVVLHLVVNGLDEEKAYPLHSYKIKVHKKEG
jgi:hypothetical protein